MSDDDDLSAALAEIEGDSTDALEAIIADERKRERPTKEPAQRAPSTGRPKRGSLESRVLEPMEWFGQFIDRIDPDDICGNAIAAGAPEFAAAVDQLARENAKFRAWIESATTGTATVRLILAVGGIAGPILAAHRPARRLPRSERTRRRSERANTREMMERQMAAEYDAIADDAPFEMVPTGNGDSPVTPSRAPNPGDGDPVSFD